MTKLQSINLNSEFCILNCFHILNEDFHFMVSFNHNKKTLIKREATANDIYCQIHSGASHYVLHLMQQWYGTEKGHNLIMPYFLQCLAWIQNHIWKKSWLGIPAGYFSLVLCLQLCIMKWHSVPKSVPKTYTRQTRIASNSSTHPKLVCNGFGNIVIYAFLPQIFKYRKYATPC